LYDENHFAIRDEVAAKNQKLQQKGVSEEVYCSFSTVRSRLWISLQRPMVYA